MTEPPASFETMPWLLAAVWLLGGLAYLADLPGDIVVAMLILGTAATMTEWSVMRGQRNRD